MSIARLAVAALEAVALIGFLTFVVQVTCVIGGAR